MPQQEKFRPYLDVDASFALAPTSARRMRELDRLRIDAAMTSDEGRRRLAEEYCLDVERETDEEGEEVDGGQIVAVDGKEVPTVAKDAFYVEAAKIIFEGGAERGEEVNVAAVRRALGKFDLAGTEHLQELGAGFAASNGSPTRQSQTTST